VAVKVPSMAVTMTSNAEDAVNGGKCAVAGGKDAVNSRKYNTSTLMASASAYNEGLSNYQGHSGKIYDEVH
jgi:hypothetical protein